MASNPYGITQIDIPGLLGMHQKLKRQRMEDLATQQKYELDQRKADREDRKDAAIANVFTPQASVAPQVGGGAQSIIPGSETPQAGALPALDQHLPPRTDGIQINQGALQALYAADPQTANQVQKMIYESSAENLKAATARGEAMAVASDALKRLPPAQRQAEYQTHWAPWLAEHGYAQQQLVQAGSDLSDTALDRHYRQGQTLAQVIASNKPDVRVLPAGATLYDMKSGRGVAMNGPKAGAIVDGYHFKGGDPNNEANYEAVGGGASDGTSGF